MSPVRFHTPARLTTVVGAALLFASYAGCTPKDGVKITLERGAVHPNYSELIQTLSSAGFEEVRIESAKDSAGTAPGGLRSTEMRSLALPRFSCVIYEVVAPTPLQLICIELPEPNRPKGMSPEGKAAVKRLLEGLREKYGDKIIGQVA